MVSDPSSFVTGWHYMPYSFEDDVRWFVRRIMVAPASVLLSLVVCPLSGFQILYPPLDLDFLALLALLSLFHSLSGSSALATPALCLLPLGMMLIYMGCLRMVVLNCFGMKALAFLVALLLVHTDFWRPPLVALVRATQNKPLPSVLNLLYSAVPCFP
jgi:hypothetical protein